MSLERVTAATGSPVDVTTVKLLLRIDGAAFDALLAALIPAAARYLERAYGCALLASTWRVWRDAAPVDGGPMELPIWPVTAVSSVVTYSDAGVAATMSTSDYHVDVASPLARVALRSSATWPTGLRSINAIAVTVEAGAADDGDVDPMLKLAVAQLCGYWIEHPEAVGDAGGVNELPLGVRALMAAAAPVSLA